MNNKRVKSKVILIEGMSGTGKSILAQNIWFTYNNLGCNSEWFHEQESNHPIFQEEYYKYLDENKLNQFTNTILNNWINFFNQNTKEFYIFEGQVLLSYLATLVWYGFSGDTILEESKELIELFKEQLETCILLETHEPEKIIANTIKNRGQKWKENYLNEFNDSPYSINNNIQNLTGLNRFWLDVFKLYNDFSKSINDKTLKVDITDQYWNKNYKEISDYLKINIQNSTVVDSDNTFSKYCGIYTNEQRIIKVYENQKQLYCDFGWPNLLLSQVKDSEHEFYIKGFPHRLQFNLNKNEIVITGKDIVNLKGEVFTKS